MEGRKGGAAGGEFSSQAKGFQSYIFSHKENMIFNNNKENQGNLRIVERGKGGKEEGKRKIAVRFSSNETGYSEKR